MNEPKFSDHPGVPTQTVDGDWVVWPAWERSHTESLSRYVQPSEVTRLLRAAALTTGISPPSATAGAQRSRAAQLYMALAAVGISYVSEEANPGGSSG